MNNDESSDDSHAGGTRGDSGRSRNRGNPLSDLPDKILELLRASPAAELEHHVKAMVAQAADRMDLVPREEFEIQKAMVDRLRERVETLEKQLKDQSG